MTTTITENTQSLSLAEVSTSIQAIERFRDAIAAIEKEHPKSLVVDVTTPTGMRAAIAARAAWREPRIATEKARKEAKAPILKLGREIDLLAADLEAQLRDGESNYDAQIKKEEQRKELEKAAKEQAEREAREALHKRFESIRALPLRAVNATCDEIDAVIVEAEEIDATDFPADMQASANFEKKLAITALRAAKDARWAQDREAEKIAAERVELERLRNEAAAVQAERERLAAEEAERQAAEVRRVEAVEREKREAIERAEREAREAEQARIDAERAEQRRVEDAERAEAVEKLRKEQEAAAAERAKLDADKEAAAKREREQAIANASLISAATEAVALLKAEGFADHIITQKLDAAISREPQRKAA